MSDVRDPATDLGPTIVDGVILRHSASGLEKADERAGEGGCARKWYYSRIDPEGRKRDKESHVDAKNAGTAMHASLTSYLRTGDAALLTGDAMRALHLLPACPGPDLRTELSIHECVPAPRSKFAPNGLVARSPLELGGVPYVGYMDLVHERAWNYGADDGEDPRDPEGTIEIADFKRKKSPTKRDGTSIVPHANDLRHKIQMAGYGMWAFRATRAKFVRLSHIVVFADSTPARKVTKLHVIDDLLPTWEHAGTLARIVTDAAKETSPDRVRFNKAACDAFGGCPHREHCRGYKTTSLAGVLNERDLMGLVEQMAAIQQQQIAGQTTMLTHQAVGAGVMTTTTNVLPTPVVAGPQMPFPGMQPAPYTTVTTTPQAGQYVQTHPLMPVATTPDPTVPTGAAEQAAAQRAALEAEEARLRAQAAQTQALAAPPTPVAPPEHPILAKLRLIASAGLGSPAMAQEVAQAYAAACGVQLGPNAGFAGTGQYGAMTLFTLPQVDQMIDHMRASGALPPAPVAPPAIGVLPPDAPASRPELATAGEPKPAAEGEKPKKRGPGRPPGGKKNKDAPSATNTIANTVNTAEVVVEGEDVLDAFFVDCAPTFPCEFLDAHFDSVCDALVARYCVNADGTTDVQDVRCAPEGGKLSHGKWKGAVAELIAATPIPAGSYVFRTYGDELRRIAADAYRRVALARGALFIRGA